MSTDSLNWREPVNELAKHEITVASKLRMFITVLVSSNWVTLQALILYATDTIPADEALQTSIFATIILVMAYFVATLIPTIARNIQRMEWTGSPAYQDNDE